MILLIDNYDSFVFNLRRYLEQLGQVVVVARNDDPVLLEDLSSQYSAIVISPGPKAPSDAGHCLGIVEKWSGILPILGVCLGHQTIYQAFGGEIVKAHKPIHGKSSAIQLEPSRLFDGIEPETHFARYHSLVGSPDSLPDWLKVTAWSEPDREIMAVEHREHPTFGVQFHPESVLSPAGHQLLRNFLLSTGQPHVGNLPDRDLREVPATQQVKSDDLPGAQATHTTVLPTLSW